MPLKYQSHTTLLLHGFGFIVNYFQYYKQLSNQRTRCNRAPAMDQQAYTPFSTKVLISECL
jgi:hypothetical protein